MSEQPYTPDTETVREQYAREQPPHIGTVSSKSAEFDAWLAKVKADARDEGWVSRHNYDERGGEAPTPNPYLEDRHVDQ